MWVHCWSRRPQGMDIGWPGDWPCPLCPGDLGVEDVRAVGVQVSDHINIGVEMHLLAPIYTLYPNTTHKKRLPMRMK